MRAAYCRPDGAEELIAQLRGNDGQPAPEARIAQTDDALGVAFPDELRAFYAIANGVRRQRLPIALAVLTFAAACSDDPYRVDADAADLGASRPNPCPRAGERMCAGECVDTLTDDDNCGICGAYCPSTEHCVDGTCRVVDCTTAPFAMCGSECVDTRIHPAHCGGCDSSCPQGDICRDGECVCPGTLSHCNGRCVDVESDDVNCGECGRICAGRDRCIDGVCLDPCTPPLAWCNDVCVDSQTNLSHCGACNHPCVAPLECLGGYCRCPDLQELCPTSCEQLIGAPNCGQCGFNPPLGATCVDGEAVCDRGYRACGESSGTMLVCAPAGAGTECDPCDGGATCPEDSHCSAGTCVAMPGRNLHIRCGGPYALGDPAVQCHAYLQLDGGALIEVTRSPFLTWSERACSGDMCPRDGPRLVGGPGDTTGTGVFTPSAMRSDDASGEVRVTVRASYVRGGTFDSADAPVLTQPLPGD